MNKLSGFLALLSCAVIFASFSIFVRLLGQDLQPFQQIGFRNIIGLILAMMIIFFTKQSFSSLGKVPSKYVFLYAGSFPFSVIFYTLAVLQIKIVTTIFGLYLGALITSLVIGVVIFKEKISRIKTASLILVSIGLLIYAYPFDRSFFSLGFFFAVLAGFFDASANSFRKYLAGKVDRFVLVFLQMIGGIAVAFPLMFFSHQLFLPHLSVQSWIVGIVFGCCLVAISYLTLVGFQNFDLNLGTVILSSEIFFGSMLAVIIFQESVLFKELVGGCFIISATALANISIQKDTRLHKVMKILKLTENVD